MELEFAGSTKWLGVELLNQVLKVLLGVAGALLRASDLWIGERWLKSALTMR